MVGETPQKEWLGTGTAAQGGGAITVPGGVQCGDVEMRDVVSGNGGDGWGWTG